MPRSRSDQPSYRYHVSGQAVVTFCGQNFYLGPHDSPESKAKYFALLAEYLANGKKTPKAETHQADTPITVACVTGEFREHVEIKYANNPNEAGRFRNLCTLLEDEYGDLPADEFGPRKLADVRDLFVASGNNRRYANTQVRNVVRIFKHAISRELICAEVLIRLETLEPLRRGQTTARESTPRTPADIDAVRATAKHLSPTLTAMVRIQAATGMRPSEIARMRPADIDRSLETWIYRPAEHKTVNYGRSKAIPIVGDARDALTPFLLRDSLAYCFSPRESKQWYQDQRTTARVTPLSHGDRVGSKRKANPKRQPGDRYSKDSYRRAIQRAAEKAKVQAWYPYQLRHLAGTVVRDALGVEAAQALLGHSRAAMTEHYAKLTEAKAIEAARVAPSVG